MLLWSALLRLIDLIHESNFFFCRFRFLSVFFICKCTLHLQMKIETIHIFYFQISSLCLCLFNKLWLKFTILWYRNYISADLLSKYRHHPWKKPQAFQGTDSMHGNDPHTHVHGPPSEGSPRRLPAWGFAAKNSRSPGVQIKWEHTARGVKSGLWACRLGLKHAPLHYGAGRKPVFVKSSAWERNAPPPCAPPTTTTTHLR